MHACAWCTLSPDEQKWKLLKSKNWSVYLADEQDYIGHCILVLNRHCARLSGLTDEEWMELKRLIDRLESCFQAVLGAEPCNWSCLMNSFYKEQKPDAHLHLHVRPRCKAPVLLHGTEYKDEEFGHHYDPNKKSRIDPAGRRELFEKLKKQLENTGSEPGCAVF